MKQRTIYRCEYCEHKSLDKEEVREHEANCLMNTKLKNCMTCKFPWGFHCEEVVPAIEVSIHHMKTMEPCSHWVLSKQVESDDDKLWNLYDDD